MIIVSRLTAAADDNSEAPVSLANRLKSAHPNPTNAGCQSCKWWASIRPESRDSINAWLDAGHSQAQLYEILTGPSDDPKEPALSVSLTGWRHHMRHHAARCR